MRKESEIPDEEPLEVVAVTGPAEAQMIEEMLKNNAIDSTLQGVVLSNPWPTVSDLDEVRVLVKPVNAAHARELVDAFFTPVTKDELVEDQPGLGVDNPDDPSGFTV